MPSGPAIDAYLRASLGSRAGGEFTKTRGDALLAAEEVPTEVELLPGSLGAREVRELVEEHPRRHADVVVGLDDEVRPGRDAVAHEGRDLAGFRRVRVPAEHGYDVARPLRLRDDRVRRPHGVRRRLPALQFLEVAGLQLRVVDPGHRQADVEPRRNSRGLVEAAAAPADRRAPLRAHLRRRALVGDVDRRGPRAAQGPQGGEARLRTDGLLLLCESSPNGLGLVPPLTFESITREPDAEYAEQKDESLAVRVAGHDLVRVPSMIAYEKSVTLV